MNKVIQEVSLEIDGSYFILSEELLLKLTARCSPESENSIFKTAAFLSCLYFVMSDNVGVMNF